MFYTSLYIDTSQCRIRKDAGIKITGVDVLLGRIVSRIRKDAGIKIPLQAITIVKLESHPQGCGD